MRDLKILKSIPKKDDDSMNYYLQDIAKVKLIDTAEEIRLAGLIRKGDLAAEHKLVRANLRFVVSCARKYAGKGIPVADLVSEGNIGLIRAAKKFDETKGFKFISYAVWWIREAMLSLLNEHRSMIRLPMNQQTMITALNAESDRLEQLLERRPSLEELAEAIGKTIDQLPDHMDPAYVTVSYDDLIPNKDMEEMTLLDVLPHDEATEVQEQIEKEALCHQLSLTLEKLTARERKIVELSFGVFGKEALSHEEIGEQLDLSAERVRQIKKSAIEKLRKSSKPGF